jgi:hypothetical protein
MIKVQDIAYVRFAAPDLAVMQRFAADFGLALTARESDTLGIGSRSCVFASADNTHYVKLLTIVDKLFRCGVYSLCSVKFGRILLGLRDSTQRTPCVGPIPDLPGPSSVR